MTKQVRIQIQGQVQGVSFSYFAQQKARELNLLGEIQNKKDGSVEVIVQGEPESLEQFIRWCKSGPERASVEYVSVHEQPVSSNYNEFRVVF
jgi:acylphosphatase